MSEYGDDSPGEKTRLCPSCRCAISVWATKCRFCGEEVGRPKEEARELSSKDLGGETIQHRAPSGSVMEALESFRAEEDASRLTHEEELRLQKSSLFRRKTPAEEPQSNKDVRDGLPELNADSLDLASYSQSSASRSATKKPPQTLAQRAPRMALIGIAVLVGLFLAVKGFGMARDYIDRRNNPEVEIIPNRAWSIYESTGDYLSAIEEASQVFKAQSLPKNEDILNDLIAVAEADLRARLEDPDWSRGKIDEALRIANRVYDHYGGVETDKLVEMAKAESRLYNVVLNSVDTEAKVATFASGADRFVVSEYRPGSPDEPELILDRFRVASVTSQGAIVEDVGRRNASGVPRRIRFELHGRAENPK